MNICGTTGTTVKAFYIFAPHKQIVRELPMIFKDFLRITDALRHKGSADLFPRGARILTLGGLRRCKSSP